MEDPRRAEFDSSLSGATNAPGGAQSKRSALGHFASYHIAPPQQGGSQTFTTVADAYVAGDATTTNYGTSTTLRADASPDLNSYLRFDVQGLTGSVTSATLRIYANSASSTGYTLHAVTDNTWTETGITYSNAPAMGTQFGASGTISANTWTTVDVTSYITGNGTYNLAFSTTSSTNISFSSREGANAPQLVIETSTGATNTPTATATAGPSPTPTRTPTTVGTNTPTAPPTVTPTTQPVFQNATFLYDGDGKRVKSIINGTITTYFVGSHFELSGSTVTKYYYAGAPRIAMRSGTWDFSSPVTGTLSYLLGDHLGSTSLTTDAAGNKVSEVRYKAWGEVRYASGNMPTRYQYTGQFSHMDDFGLMFYNARWYDPYITQFSQPDSIIPDTYDPQDWNRYAYARNNPVRYTDPTGHGVDCGIGMGCVGTPPTPDQIDQASLTKAGKAGYAAYLKVFSYDFNAWYWKDPRLGGDGNLTIEDFVAMNFNEELGLYQGDVSDWQQALVRGYNTWKSEMDIRHPGNTYTSGKAALLNFMSRQTNIASNRPGPANFDGPATRLDDALTVVNTQIDPVSQGHGDWAAGCISDKPCQTGSHSPGSNDLVYIRTFIGQGCEPSYAVLGPCAFNESFMFILDADDVNHWSGVVD